MAGLTGGGTGSGWSFPLLTAIRNFLSSFRKTSTAPSPTPSPTSSGLSAAPTESVSSGPAPLSVSFTSNATGGKTPYTYQWQFGDGGTSTAANPTHSYTSAGTYTPSLVVTDSTGSSYGPVYPGTITVSSPSSTSLTAKPSESPTTGTAPLVVSFTSNASGGSPPYTYQWQFGDGGTSTAANPSHSYAASGVYTPTLTVTDSSGNTYGPVALGPVSVTSAPPPSPVSVTVHVTTAGGSALYGAAVYVDGTYIGATNNSGNVVASNLTPGTQYTFSAVYYARTKTGLLKYSGSKTYTPTTASSQVVTIPVAYSGNA
jgi:PKD repeat protein